ncbi:MAG: winged helix-turn-helix domain-containing protein [Anaerolineae bacterium]
MLQRANYQDNIEFGILQLNPHLRSASIPGSAVRLTPIEYQLLHNLITADGRPVSNGQLLGRVWGKSYASCHDYLWVHMCRLRRKLNQHGFPALIVNERGQGYRLRRLVG